MRILFLAQGNESHQSTQHRMLWPARALEQKGHDCDLLEGFTFNAASRGVRVVSPRSIHRVIFGGYDVIVFNRDASPFAALSQLSADIVSTPTIFDFDDAIYTNMNISGTRIPNPTRVFLEEIIGRATHVTASADALTDYARNYNTNVSCLRTPVNTDIFNADYKRHCEHDKPVIGWMGVGTNHKKNLELLVEPLMELSEEYDFVFKLVSALSGEVQEIFEPLEGNVEIDYGFDRWQPIEQIAREMMTFDISVCPLNSSSEFMRGKSAMKVFENMAVGIPVVASDFGEYGAVIRDGCNALLAESSSDWVGKIACLISNPDERSRIGCNGKRYVYEKHTLEKYVCELERLLQVVASE